MAVKSKAVMVRSLFSAVRLALRPGGPSLPQRAAAIPRLVGAALRGEYAGVTLSRLMLLAGAVGYVLSPVDLVPEALLGPLGLADDAFVLSWIATQLVVETEDFLAWEQGQPASQGAATPDVVQGHVVR